MSGQSNQDAQTEKRDTVSCRRNSSHNTSNLSQVSYSQVDVHTLEENFVSKVRSEVDHVITTVETRVQGAVLTAKESFVTPRVGIGHEIAQCVLRIECDGRVWEPDQRVISSNIECLLSQCISNDYGHEERKGHPRIV